MSNAESMKEDGSPERAMWLEVLKQAVDDVVEPKYCAYKYEIAEAKQEAHKLLFEINENHIGGYTHWFETICGLANVYPSSIRALAIRKLAENKNVS